VTETQAAPVWSIRSEHPRILFHRDARVDDGRPLVTVLAERFRDPRYAPQPAPDLARLSSEMLALRWSVLREEAAAQRATENLLNTRPPTGNELGDAYVAERLGVTYDWLHDFLAARPEEKRQIESRMMEYVRRFRRALPNITIFHNYAHAAIAGYTHLVLALAHGPYDAELREDLALLTHFIGGKDMLLDGWAYQDGAWHEGIEYGLSECFAPLVLTLAAIQSATSPAVDYFARARREQNDWINRFCRYLISKRRPDWTYERDGDVLPNWVFIGWRTYTPMLLVAHQYRDPVLYSYLREVVERDPRATSRFEHQFLILGKEPDAPRSLWKTLPLSARFGQGAFEHLFFRSGWDADDTLVSVRAGDYFTHHQHPDAGHFTIYHRGALAIDSGFYAGMYNDHWSNYAARTIAHNCVTIYNPAEKFERYAANDGGQRVAAFLEGGSTQASPWQGNVAERKDHLFKEPAFRMGEVLHCAFERGVHHVAIDLTRAYNSTRFATWQNQPKISDYTRDLVYVPGEEYVVVFDRVVSTSADYAKTWLLHTVEKPTMVAGEAPTGADGLIRGRGRVVRVDRHGTVSAETERRPRPASTTAPGTPPASAPTGEPSSERSPATQTAHLFPTYDGRMFLESLLPAQAAVSIRGGPGFEFWCDGANRAVDARSARYSNAESPREAGAWRIEITPLAPDRETRFLTVMKLGRQTDLVGMPAVRLIGDETSPAVGVAFPAGLTLSFRIDERGPARLEVKRLTPF
jgi:hypothetical protein